METDRGAVLTVRAAVRGVVDFRAARVRDVRWWRRLNVLLRAIAKEDELTTTQMAFDYQLSLVGNPALLADHWARARKEANNLFREGFFLIKPWAAASAEDLQKGEIAGLIEEYKKVQGDPRDPAFRKKLDADMAASRARRLAARETARRETEDGRVSRLIREREARRRVR